MIKGLHHSAYRCRDSEESRKFYEDFLGLKLVGSLAIKDSPKSTKADVLHTFFQMADGSCLAFFEAPAMPFEFKPQLSEKKDLLQHQELRLFIKPVPVGSVVSRF